MMALFQLVEDKLAFGGRLLELALHIVHEPRERAYLFQEVSDEANQATQPAMFVLSWDQLLESIKLLFL